MKVWSEHLMKLHDIRFRDHYSFMFYVQNLLNIEYVCNSAKYSVSSSFSTELKVTSKQLRDAYDNKYDKTKSNDPEVFVHENVCTVGVDLCAFMASASACRASERSSGLTTFSNFDHAVSSTP